MNMDHVNVTHWSAGKCTSLLGGCFDVVFKVFFSSSFLLYLSPICSVVLVLRTAFNE